MTYDEKPALHQEVGAKIRPRNTIPDHLPQADLCMDSLRFIPSGTLIFVSYFWFYGSIQSVASPSCALRLALLVGLIRHCLHIQHPNAVVAARRTRNPALHPAQGSPIDSFFYQNVGIRAAPSAVLATMLVHRCRCDAS